MTECCLCDVTIPVWLRIKPEDHLHDQPQRAFLAKYEGKALCPSCTTRLEIDYIKGIPLEELPLFISVEWISDDGSAAYQARLSGIL